MRYLCIYLFQLKKSEQQGTFVHFHHFEKDVKNLIFGNSQNVLIFLAQMNNIMLGNVGFKIFCNDFTALSE